MRNVHEYDGKIPIKVSKVYNETEIQRIVNDAGFLSNMCMDAKHMNSELLLFGNRGNYDPLNQHTDARQLYVALLEKIFQLPSEDQSLFHLLLEEQLCDMKRLGSCPQGRTIRLWQLFQCLEEEKK